jgi:hypothetical protein
MPADRDPAKALLEACAPEKEYEWHGVSFRRAERLARALRICVEALEKETTSGHAHHEINRAYCSACRAQEALARAAEEVG